MPDQAGGAVLDMVLGQLGIDGSALIPGYGDGVATIAVDLDHGFTVGHSWVTGVVKYRAGGEQRMARNDIDRERYSGSALLLDGNPRAMRAMLARFASLGETFLLSLPNEALVLRANAVGESVPVFADALALTDWTRPGQRVVVEHDGEHVDAVIQSVSADAITLDVAPGTVGVYGGTIMPVKAVHLEPQQDFERFESLVERWRLAARAAMPLDFAPALATIPLSGLSAPFADVVMVSRVFGLAGNTLALEFAGSAVWPDEGQLIESGPLTLFRYKPGVTSLGDLETAMESSANFVMTGTWNTAATFSAFDDVPLAEASGGSDQGDVGTGATVEEYEGRPVWDRDIAPGTDGAHAMTQIIDHDGVPYALGTADQADWPRSVILESGDQMDWQWFKLFMHTVRGRQKKFWLATWRDDLVYESHLGASVVVEVDAGDFTAWWPRLRQHVQVLQSDNTVTYAEVLSHVNNGDGTRTLTLSESLGGAAVEKISWIELCRWESGDRYETVHGPTGFSVSLIARVVP
jgi:hypothetical protein